MLGYFEQFGLGIGGSMNDHEVIMVGRAIDGLSEVRDILRVLISHGTLPQSWTEIMSVMDSIRNELSQTEQYLLLNNNSAGLGQW